MGVRHFEILADFPREKLVYLAMPGDGGRRSANSVDQQRVAATFPHHFATVLL